jgi:cold shock CspA family protein
MTQKSKPQSAIQKGVLFTWKDEKGFGFILPENGSEKIFIHISAFGKISRRPKEGDIIYYHLKTTEKGKKSAYHAIIEGVKSDNRRTENAKSRNQPVSNRVKKSKRLSRKPAPKKISFRNMIAVLIVVSMVFVYGISKMLSPSSQIEDVPQAESPQIETSPPSSQSPKYHCAGKVYCSEMVSCGEAKYYLRNCPNVKIDGDGDGIPCESQHCRY